MRLCGQPRLHVLAGCAGPLRNGDAAMYVMGNFAVGGMKDAGLTDAQIDFFPFR